MTKLMAHFKSPQGPIAQAKSNSFWRVDFNPTIAIVKSMTAYEADEFMGEILKMKANDENTEFFGNFFNSDAAKPLLDLVSDETLGEYIDFFLDNYKTNLNGLTSLYNFKNLSLENILRLLNYEPSRYPENMEKDKYSDTGMSLKYNRRINDSLYSCLVEHPNMTQDTLDSLAGERAIEGSYLRSIAAQSTNPATILKCVKASVKSRASDYYTMQAALGNKATTIEMMEEMAGYSDSAAAAVIGHNRCTKDLRTKLSVSAKGEAAGALLQSGKTDPDVITKLVETNDDPSVLENLARNRSKKVPVDAVVKAFAKIPDNQYWVKQRFLKRADLGKALADLARKSTGAVPTWTLPEDEDEDDAA